MFEQFNTKQMFVNSKQMADIAFKAHETLRRRWYRR